MDVGPLVSQDQSGQKHEQIHDQVKLGREGGENPVGAAHRGHEQEYKNQGRHHQGLEEQDVHGDIATDLALQNGRQQTVPCRHQQPLAGPDNPGSHLSEGACHNKQGDNGHQPEQVIGGKKLIKGLHESGHQTDLLLGHHKGNGEGA